MVGIFIGIHGGAGAANDSFDQPDLTIYGAQAGYLWDLGTIVAGGEVQYSALQETFWNEDISALRLKGRLGYDAGTFQPYVSLGAAQISSPTRGTGTMYTGSVGADAMIGSNMLIGVELIHDANPNFSWSGGGGTFDFQFNTVVLKASYKF